LAGYVEIASLLLEVIGGLGEGQNFILNQQLMTNFTVEFLVIGLTGVPVV